MKERIEAIADLRLSCSALYTAVPESVADDVKRRAEAVIKTHEAEIERLRGENAEYKSIFTRCRDIVAFHNGDDAEKVEAIRRTLLQKGSSNDE